MKRSILLALILALPVVALAASDTSTGIVWDEVIEGGHGVAFCSGEYAFAVIDRVERLVVDISHKGRSGQCTFGWTSISSVSVYLDGKTAAEVHQEVVEAIRLLYHKHMPTEAVAYQVMEMLLANEQVQ